MKEADIVRRILIYLNALPGCHAQKLHGDMYGVAGSPDIFGCYRGGSIIGYGKAFLIEAKAPGGKLRDSQVHQLDLWAKAGARTIVAYELADVKKMIEEFDSIEIE